MIRYNARITRHPGTFVSEMQRHVTQGTAHTALLVHCSPNYSSRGNVEYIPSLLLLA